MTYSKDERYDLNIKKKKKEKLEIPLCFPQVKQENFEDDSNIPLCFIFFIITYFEI